MKQQLTARQLNLVKYADLKEERPVIAKVRYKDPGGPGIAWQTGDDELTVAFASPRKAITPGQSVVLYEGDDLLGGGWIQSVGEPASLEK